MTGVAAVALAASVQPLPTQQIESTPAAQIQRLSQFEIELAAQAQLLSQQPELVPELLSRGEQAKETSGTPSAIANAILPQLPTPSPIGGAQSIGGFIEQVYNAVEPWVAYGFELVQYAAGFVIGRFAQQIGIVYDFWEPIVRSVVFNFADFIDGDVTFWQGLSNIGTAIWDSTVQFVRNELIWIRGWFPPPPPISFAVAEQQANAAADDESPSPAVSRALAAPADPASSPETSPAKTGPAEPADDAEEPAEEAQSAVGDAETTDAGSADEAEPQAEVVETADTEPADDAAPQSDETAAQADDTTSSEAVTDTEDQTPVTTVRAQGDVRGAAVEDGADVTETSGGTAKSGRGDAEGPKKFSTAVRDSVRQITNGAKNLRENLRSALRGSASGSDSDSVSAD